MYGDKGQEKLKYLKSVFKTDRDALIHMENLELGEYAILMDIDWTNEMAEREFVVSSYGLESEFCEHHEASSLVDILSEIYLSFAKF